MKKVCLQAGHSGIISGSTGAPGERDWNEKIVPMIAERLRAKGVEVYETDALAYNDEKVTDTDWDLFLAVHYDADIYNDTGGFTDFPEPSTDYVTDESQRIASIIKDVYFPMTGIKYVNRSCANTRYYYMWKNLSANTPCVLIECGVGWRKPEDYETLRNYDFIADVLSSAILKALGMASFIDEDIPTSIEDFFKLKEISRYNKYWTYSELIADWVKLVKEYEEIKEDAEQLLEENKILVSEIDVAINEAISENNAEWEKKLEEYDRILKSGSYRFTNFLFNLFKR